MSRRVSPLSVGLALFMLGVLNLLTTGCSSKLAPTHEPVLAQCDAVCYQPCTKPDGDTGVRWNRIVAGDPVPIERDPNAWDALASDVVLPLAEKLRVCDARRDACVKCLNRLEQQKVIIQ